MISTHKDSLAALFKLINFSLNIDEVTIGEQDSELRCCTRVSVVNSNPTGYLVGLRNSTLLRGFLPVVFVSKIALSIGINVGLVRLYSQQWCKVFCGAAK